MQHSAFRVQLINFVTRLHETIFRVSGGRVLGVAAGMPVVMLTTKGRKTGKSHTSMLTAPVTLGDALVLVASYGGSDKHPAWFLNLRANPTVDVVTSSHRGPMHARIASADEKAALWPSITAKYADYAAYQQRTTRDIPLVILEPLPAHTPPDLRAT